MDAGVAKAALEHTMLLGALSDDVLERLAAGGRQQSYDRGATVINAGDPGGSLLVLVSGRMKVLARSPDGTDVVLAIAGPGDSLGELSLFDGAPRAATIDAAVPSTVLWLPGALVIEVLRDHPELLEELVRQQADTIRRMTGMVADLVFLELPRRVAKYVVEHADDTGRSLVGMSQSDVAASVGAVRQSVNVALRGLERRGWIRIEDRAVAIRDLPSLEQYAAAPT